MNANQINRGDTIKYASAAGVLTATVRDVRTGPTAKPGLSIPWLHITVLPTKTKPFPSYLSLPADDASLKMFKVEVVNA
jgi:hypothetical protein